MPLIRRVPKFGFYNKFKKEYQIVNVAALEELVTKGKVSDGKITPEMLYSVGAVRKKSVPVKVLGDGEMKTKLEVAAHAFSKTATEKIERAGGKAIIISTLSK